MNNTDKNERKGTEKSVYLGSVALNNNQLPEALQHFESAQTQLKADGVKDGRDLRTCLKGLTHVYKELGKVDKALDASQRLIKIDNALENRQYYIGILIKIAEDYETHGQPLKAEQAFSDALEEATTLLPEEDPLFKKLNAACAQIFKRTFKGKVISQAATHVILTAMPKPEPVDIAPKAQAQPVETEEVEKENPNDYFIAGPLPQSNRKNLTTRQLFDSMLQSQSLLITISTLLIVALIMLGWAGTKQIVQGSHQAHMQDLKGTTFSACDNLTSLSFDQDNHCTIVAPDYKGECTYISATDKSFDWFATIRGCMTHKDVWYLWQENCIVTPERTALYREPAPELAIQKEMDKMATLIQAWYKEKSIYPTSTSALIKSGKFGVNGSALDFINPFNHKMERPEIVYLRGFDRDPAWSVRGANENNDPQWKEGGIFCVCINRQKFFIHGCDRSGKPLKASDPLHYYVIACVHGATLKTEVKHSAEALNLPDLNNSTTRVYLSATPDQESSVRTSRWLSCALCWLLFGLSAIATFASHRLKRGRRAVIGFLALTVFFGALLAGWYVLAFSS